MKKLFRFFRHFIFNRTIYRTILFSYLIVNLLLLLFFGMLSIRDSTRMMTDEIIRSSNKVMEQAALGLSFNLEETKRSLILLAGNYSVASLMREAGKMEMINLIQHERNIAEITKGIYTYQSLISDVLILGQNGYVNNLNGRNSLQWDYAFRQQPWVQESFRSHPDNTFFSLGVHVQNYYLKDDTSRYGLPTLSVGMKVQGFQGDTVGSVIANLDLDKLNGMFERSAYHNRGNIFLIDENHTIIVHQDREQIGHALKFQGIEKLDSDIGGNFTEEIDGEEHLVIYQPTVIKGLTMIATVTMKEISDQSIPLKSNLIRILYLCILLNTLISVVITFRISRPVSRLLMTLDRMGGDDTLFVKNRDYRYQELNHIGTKFKELMNRIELLIQQNYLTRIALKDEEFKALQSQINPHFLFNTLQLLQTEIVCGNIQSSNTIVLSLSSLFRYSMRQSDEMAELATELAHMKDYLFIMNKKYEDRITVTVHIPDPAVLAYKIPKLILQPMAENSIRHGFGENRREGAIQLSVLSVKRGLLIVIRDTGKGMDRHSLKALRRHIDPASPKPGNIGLYNVNHRIKLKFGNDYGIYIRSDENVHTTLYILLPVIPGGADLRKGDF
ncbi:sensor histidine kinase [Paenibacillus sepulcri]|uniref:Histidine kinase n=1 Tax=Paenibacillus sepulcri TaxID=359917 RepID=A0ABS7C2H2_9BACL|nr:histidine kinase [Paenibacillus sepulcri]